MFRTTPRKAAVLTTSDEHVPSTRPGIFSTGASDSGRTPDRSGPLTESRVRLPNRRCSQPSDRTVFALCRRAATVTTAAKRYSRRLPAKKAAVVRRSNDAPSKRRVACWGVMWVFALLFAAAAAAAAGCDVSFAAQQTLLNATAANLEARGWNVEKGDLYFDGAHMRGSGAAATFVRRRDRDRDRATAGTARTRRASTAATASSSAARGRRSGIWTRSGRWATATRCSGSAARRRPASTSAGEVTSRATRHSTSWGRSATAPTICGSTRPADPRRRTISTRRPRSRRPGLK